MNGLRAILLALLLTPGGCLSTHGLGARSTTLPADGAALPVRFHRGVCIVDVALPGRSAPVPMLLDTGTDRLLLDLAFARSLGLRSTGDESVITATGAAVGGSHLTDLPWLQLGAARFEHVDVVGLDLSSLREHGGLDVVGIVGSDLFRGCLLEIDYPRRSARVLAVAAAPPHPPHRFHERSPWVDLDVAGTAVRALVDTGFQQSLALPPGTDLPWRRRPRDAGDIAAIDGKASKAVAQVDGAVRLGALEWVDPWIVLVPGVPKLGTAFLRNCVVWLDVGGGRVWIDRRR